MPKNIDLTLPVKPDPSQKFTIRYKEVNAYINLTIPNTDENKELISRIIKKCSENIHFEIKALFLANIELIKIQPFNQTYLFICDIENSQQFSNTKMHKIILTKIANYRIINDQKNISITIDVIYTFADKISYETSMKDYLSKLSLYESDLKQRIATHREYQSNVFIKIRNIEKKLLEEEQALALAKEELKIGNT